MALTRREAILALVLAVPAMKKTLLAQQPAEMPDRGVDLQAKAQLVIDCDQFDGILLKRGGLTQEIKADEIWDALWGE